MKQIVCTDTGETFSVYIEYLKSKHWKLKKKEFYSLIDNCRCSNCGTTEKLHVHHKTYKNIGNESLDDLVCLCQSCHALEHPKKKRVKKDKTVNKPVILDKPVYFPPIPATTGVCFCCGTVSDLQSYKTNKRENSNKRIILCSSCRTAAIKFRPDIDFYSAVMSYNANNKRYIAAVILEVSRHPVQQAPKPKNKRKYKRRKEQHIEVIHIERKGNLVIRKKSSIT